MAKQRMFYALAPNGVVHRIAAASINEMESIQAFGRLEVFHLFEVKSELAVERDIETRFNQTIFGERVQHLIQNAFLKANGTIVDHASPRAFFEAVGYTDAAKKLCKANERKFIRASKLGNGRFTCIDDLPYRVALKAQGSTSGA